MQNIIITGGNVGIGLATAISLAKSGNRIIILSRNKTKVEQAITKIKQASEQDQVYGITCDLSSISSIKRSTQLFKDQFSHLDILINNAGVVTDKLQFTKDGFELHIGVNHLGHFLLTSELIDLLLISEKPRIINVSSNAHLRGEIKFDTFEGSSNNKNFKGMKSYSQSKLANVLFTKELARRHPNITSHSLHPGVVRTNIANKNDNSKLWKAMWTLAKPIMLTPEKGAGTSIYLAQSNEVLDVNGRYYYKKREFKPSAFADDKVLAERLWDISKELVSRK